MKIPTKAFIVVDEKGKVVNTTRIYLKIGPAKALVTSKVSMWKRNRDHYFKYKDTSDYSNKVWSEFYENKEPPTYKIMEADIDWKEYKRT